MSVNEVIVRTEELGGGDLARLARAGSASPWFVPLPANVTAWTDRARRTAASFDEGDWAHRLAPALAPSGAAAERLERVVKAGGIAVTTGQQPGLFGGPVYTWSKALSALALADALERGTGIPVQPVFWAATDDSDFAEASTTWLAEEGGARRIALARATVDGIPMSEVPLGDTTALVDALAAASAGAVEPRIIDAVRSAYRPDATVGGAYVHLLRTLLEPLGVVVLDAAHPAVRDASDALLRDALRRSADVAAALERRTADIEQQGMRSQVPLVQRLSLVFERASDGRRQRVPLASAERVAERAPEGALGANVLLRPVLERVLLPTVAYVAGPGELAYFAQATAVADALGRERPLCVPRWSGTIIEPHVQRLLRRRGVTPDELRDPHAAERRLAEALLPAGVRAVLERLRRSIAAESATLAALEDPPLVPPSVPHGFASSSLHRIDRLERRYRAAVARRAAEEFRELATLRGALFPGGVRQERRLNLLPTVARHGVIVFTRMLEQASVHAATLVGHGAPAVPAPGERPVSATR